MKFRIFGVTNFLHGPYAIFSIALLKLINLTFRVDSGVSVQNIIQSAHHPPLKKSTG